MPLKRRTLLASLGLSLFPPLLSARPSGTPLGPSIFDQGSDHYRAQRFTVKNPDGTPDFAISVLTPATPAGIAPYLYLMDGNAVLEKLDEAMFESLASGARPVIVTIGHDGPERFASSLRLLHYTPPGLDEQGRHVGGGADRMLRLIEDIARPEAERLAALPAGQRLLWGHSFGGLFSLNAARKPESAFDHIIAASPSLWWNRGQLIRGYIKTAENGAWPKRQLDIHRGGAEGRVLRQQENETARWRAEIMARLPENILATFVETLRGAGVPGSFVTFDGLGHGPAFTASLNHILARFGVSMLQTPAKAEGQNL